MCIVELCMYIVISHGINIDTHTMGKVIVRIHYARMIISSWLFVLACFGIIRIHQTEVLLHSVQ